MANSLIKLDPKSLNVAILGYTGESGKRLAEEILKNNLFKSTTLIGRREVKYEEEYYKNATQKVINFDKVNEHEDAFRGLDVVYCCLGTTRGKSGAEGFRKVDHDYIVDSARVARKCGAKQFHLISSAGANKDSFLLYPQVKGQTEEDVASLGFEKTAHYRPKFLLGHREESRIAEKAMNILTKPFQRLTPTLFTTPFETLAKAMIANTVYKKSDESKIQIISNDEIFKLAELYDQRS